MNNPIDSIRQRWQKVLEEVDRALHLAGRSGDIVQVIGVTKYVDAAQTRELVNAGCRLLGESRPQTLWEKAELLQDLDCQWHLIGSLQRNKVRKTLPLISLIHSLDSIRLVRFIDSIAKENHQLVRGLLEINVSGDATKQGIPPSELLATLDELGDLRNVQISGLMAMAGLGSSPLQVENQFAQVRMLRDKAIARGLPDHVTLKELSMGMSDDFPLAIAQGATMVRIGSRLFPS
jgi:pyridoxal phosphate enzyme (YggS family)